jgi:hypothetical protein
MEPEPEQGVDFRLVGWLVGWVWSRATRHATLADAKRNQKSRHSGTTRASPPPIRLLLFGSDKV